MSKYDLIIFDCDGTLVDSESLINKALADVMFDMGYEKFTYEYCMSKFSGMNSKDVTDAIMLDFPDLPIKELEEKFIEKANELIPTELVTMPNAADLLEEIYNHPKCVASNGEYPIVTYSLETTGLDQYFNPDLIFTYDVVEKGKPAPDLFLMAADRFSVKPEKCLVIEDSIVGATAGIAANMDVLAIIPDDHGRKDELTKHMKQIGVNNIISNLMEIKKHLK